MDGWGEDEQGDAESRTWLAMDLLAPVHDLWALDPGDASSAVAELADGLLGEHRPALTEAALAGLLDLERALVVGAALEVAAGVVEPEVLALVEDVLVDEACRLSLMPLVNAAAALLLELERDATQHGEDAVGAGEVVRAGGRELRAEPDGDSPPRAPATTTSPPATAHPRSGPPCAGLQRCEPLRHSGRLVGVAPVARGRASARASSPADHGRVFGPGPALAASIGNGGPTARKAGRPRGPPRGVVTPHGGRRAHEDRPGERGRGVPGRRCSGTGIVAQPSASRRNRTARG